MRWVIFVALGGSLIASVFAGDAAQRATLAHRVLEVDRCCARVAGGKATLTVGSLRRTNEVFEGAFDVKVAPYFFKSDRGTLAIAAPDKTIAKASSGSPVEIKGIARSKEAKRTVER